MTGLIRGGEAGNAPPFRCERFFHVNDQWYASIREGGSIGPFPLKSDAVGALALYIREQNMWGEIRKKSQQAR